MAKEKQESARKGAETEVALLPETFGNYAFSFMREKGEELLKGELKPSGVKPMDTYMLALACNQVLLKSRLDKIERELGL